ncbi:MAG TPA: TIGR02466 family protein [Steroidobacteraceae bacterium]|nr:TIGR02466 family protein [Steroidobacteraceae bacterium]
MSTTPLFATQVYRSSLRMRGLRALNAQLLREIRQLRVDDKAGRQWSARHYPGGFTSYGSASRLHRLSPTFAALERHLIPHLRAFCRALEFDLDGRELSMTDCWANIMPRGVVHGLHLHPHSSISGTYYVQVPKGASGLKFEDPRLDRMMAAPPRRAHCRQANRSWVTFGAQSGHVVLFESWLRHEVPSYAAPGERVSVSFNYSWF